MSNCNSYRVYYTTSDTGRVKLPNGLYATTDIQTTTVSKTYKIVENSVPSITLQDKRIYKQSTTINSIETLKQFILDYQTAYDYEDNTDISNWWNIQETTQQLRNSIAIVDTDTNIQTIVDVINDKNDITNKSYPIHLRVTDQFNKSTYLTINLYIIQSVTDTDITESNKSTLYKYVPVNISSIYSISEFKDKQRLTLSQIQVIDNSLNNKNQSSGKSENYNINGKDIKIIEY